MIIQNRDGSLVKQPRKLRRPQPTQPTYCAEIPAELLDEQSSLIERILSFAFDTLGASHVDLRVRDSE